MAVAIRTITRLQDADDAPNFGAGQDGYALTWNNAMSAFVATAPFTGLLATGATVGATAQAQTFTNGIIGPSWKVAADSTTALQLQKAAGTSVLNVDTTNTRIGIGTTAPAQALDVAGAIKLGNSAGISIYSESGWRHTSNGTFYWDISSGGSSGSLIIRQGRGNYDPQRDKDHRNVDTAERLPEAQS